MIPGAWAVLSGLPLVETPDAGLINRTLLAGAPTRFVVQRVNPIFGPAVHQDIEAVRAIGCTGAIIGRALYDGTLDLRDALGQ